MFPTRLIGREEYGGFGDFIRNSEPAIRVSACLRTSDLGLVSILVLIFAFAFDLAGNANNGGKGKVRAKVWHFDKGLIFQLPYDGGLITAQRRVNTVNATMSTGGRP